MTQSISLFKRSIEDHLDQRLIGFGWQFQGICLFSHPNHPNMYYTKDVALRMLDKDISSYEQWSCPACNTVHQ